MPFPSDDDVLAYARSEAESHDLITQEFDYLSGMVERAIAEAWADRPVSHMVIGSLAVAGGLLLLPTAPVAVGFGVGFASFNAALAISAGIAEFAAGLGQFVNPSIFDQGASMALNFSSSTLPMVFGSFAMLVTHGDPEQMNEAAQLGKFTQLTADGTSLLNTFDLRQWVGTGLSAVAFGDPGVKLHPVAQQKSSPTAAARGTMPDALDAINKTADAMRKSIEQSLEPLVKEIENLRKKLEDYSSKELFGVPPTGLNPDPQDRQNHPVTSRPPVDPPGSNTPPLPGRASLPPGAKVGFYGSNPYGSTLPEYLGGTGPDSEHTDEDDEGNDGSTSEASGMVLP